MFEIYISKEEFLLRILLFQSRLGNLSFEDNIFFNRYIICIYFAQRSTLKNLEELIPKSKVRDSRDFGKITK